MATNAIDGSEIESVSLFAGFVFTRLLRVRTKYLYIKRNGVTYESMWHSLSVDVSSNAINRISHCLLVTKDEPRN